MRDVLNLYGEMTANVFHKDGTVSTVKKHNMIVSSGFDVICALIADSGESPMSKIVVGSGTSATTSGMLALEGKITEKAANYSHAAGTKIFTMTADFLEGEAVGALNEAGVFNDDDKMFDRVTFKTLNIDESDRVNITFTFTLA